MFVYTLRYENQNMHSKQLNIKVAAINGRKPLIVIVFASGDADITYTASICYNLAAQTAAPISPTCGFRTIWTGISSRMRRILPF